MIMKFLLILVCLSCLIFPAFGQYGPSSGDNDFLFLTIPGGIASETADITILGMPYRPIRSAYIGNLFLHAFLDTVKSDLNIYGNFFTQRNLTVMDTILADRLHAQNPDSIEFNLLTNVENGILLNNSMIPSVHNYITIGTPGS
jgi:hypothetical protein